MSKTIFTYKIEYFFKNPKYRISGQAESCFYNFEHLYSSDFIPLSTNNNPNSLFHQN